MKYLIFIVICFLIYVVGSVSYFTISNLSEIRSGHVVLSTINATAFFMFYIFIPALVLYAIRQNSVPFVPLELVVLVVYSTAVAYAYIQFTGVRNMQLGQTVYIRNGSGTFVFYIVRIVPIVITYYVAITLNNYLFRDVRAAD